MQTKWPPFILFYTKDYFNKAGIEIMSPHYIATRDGNEITIPKETAEE